MIALLYLLREPRFLSEEYLRDVVSRELDIYIPDDGDDAENCVVEVEVSPDAGMPEEEVTSFLVQLGDSVFSVNNFFSPYMESEEDVRGNRDGARLMRMIQKHKAWLSMDFMGDAEDGEQQAAAYGIIGRVLAGLAGPDCLAIYAPEFDCCCEYTDSLLEMLRSGAPMSIFEDSFVEPEIDYDGDDPRINAAVEEARARWPEFVAAFIARPNDDPPFAVKARFEENGVVEYLWVIVHGIDEDAVRGTLESTPNVLKDIQPGVQVSVFPDAIYDWMYPNESGLPAGAFTMLAIEEDLGE